MIKYKFEIGTIEICRRIIKSPHKKEVQPDGRIRHWGEAMELGEKYLRVVTLKNGTTIMPSKKFTYSPAT